jgi:hypothetical protein
MIRDVAKFRRTGMVSRRVSELDLPIAAWRAAMCHAGRRDGTPVRTLLVPIGLVGPDGPWDHLVFAVRTDPPPDPAAQSQGVLRWWRVEDLGMPFGRWRAALHQVARQGNVSVKTFRVPSSSIEGVDAPGQMVYVVWADPTDPRCTTQTPAAGAVPHPRPATLPVTDLAAYRAERLGRAGSIAGHPAGAGNHGVGDSSDDAEDMDR